VAGAYDAQCTRDFSSFNAQNELQYRGRLDASRLQAVANARRDLFEAMKRIGLTGDSRISGAAVPQVAVAAKVVTFLLNPRTSI
jgi:hypothetical protein